MLYMKTIILIILKALLWKNIRLNILAGTNFQLLSSQCIAGSCRKNRKLTLIKKSHRKPNHFGSAPSLPRSTSTSPRSLQSGMVPDQCFGKGTAEGTLNIALSSSPTRKSNFLSTHVLQYRTKGSDGLGSRRLSLQDLSGLPSQGPVWLYSF